MRVFVTGPTGWVGRVVVDDLLSSGHQVVGLCRSDKTASQLVGRGADAIRGTLDDLDRLAAAAAGADAVIHLAFNHDFARFAENCEQDRRAIMAMGEPLIGTEKPMLVTTGLMWIAAGRTATEADMPPLVIPDYPRKSEAAASALFDRGARVATVRLAHSVHGLGDHGFVAVLADIARRTGVSAYVGDGTNRWPAVHVSDAGRLYRLALEAGASARAYHGSAEQGVSFRAIAEAIGLALGLPVEPRLPEHFGPFAAFVVADSPTSSTRTRGVTGWEPTGPGLLADLGRPSYFST